LWLIFNTGVCFLIFIIAIIAVKEKGENAMKKTCLVIGGGSDIGAEIVKILDKDYNVTWSYFNTFRSESPGESVKCDLRDTEQIDYLFSQVENLDLLITASFPFLECDNFDYQGYLEAEAFLRGHVYAIIEAKKRMENGKIFNILGQCVERGLPGGAFYSGAFAFLHNWGNSINGREGKSGKAAVCNLLMGPVNTREWDGLSEEVVNRYKEQVADFIDPKEIAETIKFLASKKTLPSTYKWDGYYGY